MGGQPVRPTSERRFSSAPTTLSRYPADTLPDTVPAEEAENLLTRATFTFAAQAARTNRIYVHGALDKPAHGGDGLGLNTATLVSPAGELLAARTDPGRRAVGNSRARVAADTAAVTESLIEELDTLTAEVGAKEPWKHPRARELDTPAVGCGNARMTKWHRPISVCSLSVPC
ncbi:hypothetical protein [Pseudarthrobacter sp. N5]|uniref:hypothetical protein n=1 Tax=Pseudarthrobacter sp. N5 TaxID=3418416 RepID=UPI003CE8D8B8